MTETSTARRIWESGYARPEKIQGSSLKTYSFQNPNVERVQVVVKSDGQNNMNASIDLWQGPNNSPVKISSYSDDGHHRPFNVVVETPRSPATIAIRNTAQLEFPLEAYVVADAPENGYPVSKPELREEPVQIQGGAVQTFEFDPYVDSVQVYVETDGRPLNCRIEMMQGPSNNKQVIEMFTEEGLFMPLYFILETPGTGNVVRILNTATTEFPLTASVEPYIIGDGRNIGGYGQGTYGTASMQVGATPLISGGSRYSDRARINPGGGTGYGSSYNNGSYYNTGMMNSRGGYGMGNRGYDGPYRNGYRSGGLGGTSTQGYYGGGNGQSFGYGMGNGFYGGGYNSYYGDNGYNTYGRSYSGPGAYTGVSHATYGMGMY